MPAKIPKPTIFSQAFKQQMSSWRAKKNTPFVKLAKTAPKTVGRPLSPKISTSNKLSEKNSPSGRNEATSSKSVQSYLKDYLLAAQQTGCSDSTIRNYRSDIQQFFTFAQSKELSDLKNKPKLLAFARYQRERGLADSSVKRKLISITQFKLWLKKQGLLNSEIPLPLVEGKLAAETQDTKILEQEKGEAQLKSSQGEKRNSSSDTQVSSLSEKKAKKRTPQSALMLALNLLAVFSFLTGLGYFAYQQFGQTLLTLAYPDTVTPPSRILSYQGRLTNTGQSPINAVTNMVFKLYDADTGGTELWSSNNCAIDPDDDGIFSVNLGAGDGDGLDNESCGDIIGEDVFTMNANVWLEVTVGSGVGAEILDPRQPIRTVAYAINAETLQGLPPSEEAAASTIPVMNQYGEIVLGTTTPAIKTAATSTGLSIESQAITISSYAGSNGDINLSPDGTGRVIVNSDLFTDGYLAAAGATLSATYDNGVALSLVGGPTPTANLMQWANNLGTTLGVIDEAGYLGVGTANPSYALDVAGDINFTGTLRVSGDTGTTGQVLLSQGSSAPVWSDITGAVGSNVWLQGGNSYGAIGVLGTNDNYNLEFETNGTTKMTIDTTGRVGIGTTSPSVRLSLGSTGGPKLLNLYELGNFAWGYGVSSNNLRSYAPSQNGYFSWGTLSIIDGTTYSEMMRLTNSGSVGIGTITPNSYLDISNNPTVAQNTNYAFTSLSAPQWSATNDLGTGYSIDFFSPTYNGTWQAESVGARIGFVKEKTWNLSSSGENDAGIALSTANNGVLSEVMRLSATGNVGIGTTTPISKLDVSGSASTNLTFQTRNTSIYAHDVNIGNTTSQDTILGTVREIGLTGGTVQRNAAAGYLMNSANTDYYVGGSFAYQTDTSDIAAAVNGYVKGCPTGYNCYSGYFGSAGGSYPFVVYSGDVGIGTTAPSQKLDVAGAIRLGAAAGTYDVLNTTGTGIGNDASGDLYWGNSPLLTETNLSVYGVSSVSNSDGTLTISPTVGAVVASLNLANANSWTGAQTFTANTYFPDNGIWNTSGDVGIGTTSPQGELQVHSDASQSDLIISTNTNLGSANTTQLSFISDLDGTPAYASIGQFNTADLKFSAVGNLVAPDLTILSSNGFVGIGTTAPSQKLDVAGAIRLGDAAGTYDVLNTTGTGIGNDASGDLYWGNSPLLTEANLSTYGVSSVTNSDGTLTISPTTGAVIASLNLANANSWTGAQTFTANTYFPGSGIWDTSGNVGIGTTDATNYRLTLYQLSTGLKANLFSTDQMTLGQLEGGAYFGRVGITENQWGVSGYGETWTARDSARSWYGVAMSSDGKIQTATVGGGQIYTSTDYGVNWTARDSARSWYGVAMSADGKIQTATAYGGQIYTSTDYGVNWTARDSARSWYDVNMSADGKIQTATVYNGQIYTSTDYGVNWTARDSARNWFGVAMSADGKIQTATVIGGQIYTSTDYGVTWTARDSARYWRGIAMSADGRVQTGIVFGGQIYTSTDYGVNWTARDSARNWFGVAMSADGKIQTTTVSGGQIYTSTDYGVNWTARDSARNWFGVAMSADGKIQTAVNINGQIYTSHGNSYNFGNIGIGTATPSYALDIAGDLNFTGALRAGGLAGTAGQVLLSQGTGTPVWTDITGAIDSTAWIQGGNTFGALGVLGTNDNFDLQFETNNLTRMTIDSTGFVGLGTTAPTHHFSLQALNSESSFGSNLLTNGDFATGTFANWTAGAGWSVVSGAAQHSTGTDTLYQSIALVSGTSYQIDLTQSGATAGSVTISVGAQFSDTVNPSSASKSFTFTASSTGSQNFTITPTTDYNGSLDNFVIRAINSTSTASFALLNSDGSLGWEARSGGSALANIFLGSNSGALNTTGNNNSALGNNALATNTSGYRNSAFGSASLASNSYGSSNSALGYNALTANTSGSGNSAFGDSSLQSNTTGSSNSAYGYSALYSNTSGYLNNAFGNYALYSNTTGLGNIAMGNNSLYSNLTGNYNSAIGQNALFANSTGLYNNALGSYALYQNTIGERNNAVGYSALIANTTGDDNNAFGNSALATNSTGNFNNVIGTSALTANEGSDNNVMGFEALYSATASDQNVAIGSRAGYSTTGSGNVFIGYRAGYSETGSDKLYIANDSGTPLIYGDFANGNVAIGNIDNSYRLTLHQLSTGLKANLFSTDQMTLGQLEGGAYFGRVGITENQWGVSGYGETWTARGSARGWYGLAMSSDGKIQTATTYDGQLYTSTDYGVTWTARDSSRTWRGITMSADGKIQTASVSGGYLYTSTDYGVNWTARDSNRDWWLVAMSADGKIQTATVYNGQIYTSTDYGVTWTGRDSTRNWYGVGMSADGKIQTATVYGGQIYTSTDYGVTWTGRDSARSWSRVGMSADGKIQTATVYNGQIYTSTDYGVTWTARDSARYWRGIAMSADGKVQTSAVNNGQIYTSTDYGVTWTARDSNRVWIDVAMSADGKIQTAVVDGGQIYTSHGNSYNFGNIGIGTSDANNYRLNIQQFSTGLKANLFSTDQMTLGQLEGGAYFGRVGITENQWGLSGYGETWTARDSTRNWFGVAMSADGKIQTATTYDGQLYTSTDYGVTWTGRDSSRAWREVAMSSDGKIQTASVGGGYLYTSTDYGVTWTARGSNRTWRGITMSADGKIQTATAYGQIYTSTDYGVTWKGRDTTRQWMKVAMSADGKIQTATVYGGQIYTSTDYGVTWTGRDSTRNWYGVAMSADGKIQTGVAYAGNIYTSTDYGVTWTARDTTRNWWAVTMSADGKIQTATAYGGQIYTSTDYGVTWTARDSVRNWYGVAMSADGKIQTGVAYPGQIYTSHGNSYNFGNIGIGTSDANNYRLNIQQFSTGLKANLFSTDQMTLGQLEGGAYFGRVGITENQWGLSGYGETWTARDSTRNWYDVNMSSDGKIQTASVSGGYLYTSTDYGVTWTARDSARYWRGIAMSADGKVQTSAVNHGQIYTSTDYGVTWTARDSNRAWIDVAMSADGKIQTATVYNGQIYTSTDYGVTWTARDSTRNWYEVAMSSDGKVQTATVYNGQIYTSTDYGVTWTARDSTRSWYEVAMSADGKIQTATAYGGQIYTSTDYGVTWTGRDSARSWYGVAMSADGRVQTGIVFGGQIYSSTDYGVNWTGRDSARNWYGLAMSADGKIQTGVAYNGQIYTSHANSYTVGSVGIGTTSPLNKLHVFDNVGPAAIFERSSSTTNSYIGSASLLATSTGDMTDGFGAALNFAIKDTAEVVNTIAQIYAARDGADNSGAIIFKAVSGGTYPVSMKIGSSGDVGIGTTDLTGRLSVSKSVYTVSTIAPDTDVNHNIWDGTTEYDHMIHIKGHRDYSPIYLSMNPDTHGATIFSINAAGETGTGNRMVLFGHNMYMDQGNNSTFNYRNVSRFSGATGIQMTSNYLASGGNIDFIMGNKPGASHGEVITATTAMRIDSSSRVGINTTSPRQQLSIGSLLDIYTGAANSPTTSSIRSSGNLIVNAAGTSRLYLNHDSGSGGISFHNGSAGLYGVTTSTTTGYQALYINTTNAIVARYTSSIKYKTNVQSLNPNLDNYLQITPVAFNDLGSGDRGVGVIAEQVASLIPDLATYKDGSPDGVSYQLLGVYNLAVLKKWQPLIEQLSINPASLTAALRVKNDLTVGGDLTLASKLSSTSTTPGTLYFNSEKNSLMVMGNNQEWQEVSTDLSSQQIDNILASAATLSNLGDENNLLKYQINQLFETINTSSQEVLHSTLALAEAVIGKLEVGQLTVQEINAPEDGKLEIAGNNVTIQLNDQEDQDILDASESSKLGKLLVQDENGQTVASIDSQGNVEFSGNLSVEGQSKLGQLIADEASISGTLIAENIDSSSARLDYIESQLANLDQLNANSANLGEASVTGTLRSDRIETNSISAAAIEGLQERLSEEIASALQEPSLLASLLESSTVTSNDQFIEETAETLGADLTSDPSYLPNEDGSLTLIADAALINNYFEVNGSASIAQGLAVGQNLSIAGNTQLGDGYLAYQPTELAPEDNNFTFSIQPSGRGRLSLMAGLIILDENGLVSISGDLHVAGAVEVAGELKAKDTLLTNLIKAENPDQDINIQLAQLDASDSAKVKKSNFQLVDEKQEAVASFSADGDLTLKGTLNVTQEDATDSATLNKSAGQATLLAGQTEVLISTSVIKANSMVYITPLGSTKNQVLFVKEKQADDLGTVENEGGFTVSLDFALDQDVSFNWWIVN